ncbi:MAG: hypothetical protein FWB75_02770 [Oscillospiraceae bacterium]|nr:hypothetical protein [Oscillospiraceae bacterium]
MKFPFGKHHADDKTLSGNDSKHHLHNHDKTLDNHAAFSHPERWAKSTIDADNPDGLVKIYEISPGIYLTETTIRQRTWVHDILDDESIPYYIEVKPRDGQRNLTETQSIYVEEKHAPKAVFLMNTFLDPESKVKRVNIEEEILIGEDGIPKKLCPFCDKEMDFDYYRCPHCKADIT